jgi:hypothetical protein
MEGEDSGKHEFKKPGFSDNQGDKPSEASTGDKRQLDETTSDESTVYVKDDGTELSSKELKDWNVRDKHNFAAQRYTYKTHCDQMANILEYKRKVEGHVYVNTCWDTNPFLNHTATDFFDTIVEKHKIPNAPMSDKIHNTEELRNLFRNEGRGLIRDKNSE